MAEGQLKTFFDPAMVRSIAAEMAGPGFDETRFLDLALPGLEALELTGRGWHLEAALAASLPGDFARAADHIVARLGPPVPATGTNGMAPFRYLPQVFFAAKRGMEDFEASMRLQYELTRRFSAEFSIRAWLEKDPARTLARLSAWVDDPDANVRRLVSEGTRPRLPWAPRLRAFQRDPAPVLALLERLKDDPELYVRRSVANNLNDISKDHPDRAAGVAGDWLEGASKDRRWLVGHAMRGLVKAGHPGALALFGAGGRAEVRVGNLTLAPDPPHLGDVLEFAFDLTSTGPAPQKLIADFTLGFVKANGTVKPKVFKLTRLVLGPGESLRLSARVSLADLSTRKHYPGEHTLAARINGQDLPLGRFMVLPRA